MEKVKKNILILGDHPLHVSGVAHCLRDITQALTNTGEFRVIHLGAAIKHEDMRPIKLNDDWFVIPVEGFGNIDQVNQICRENKIDIIFFQSDPRFYTWLLVRDNEVRRDIPLVWYSVWDNYPYPVFNNWVWNSVDHVVAISKLTEDLVRNVSPQVGCTYMPHTVNKNIFKPLSSDESNAFRKNRLPFVGDKFLIFWNNRNGRRKNGGMLISAFKKFLDVVGQDKAVLLMKTDPIDGVGFNLPEIIRGCEVENQVIINSEKLDEPTLSQIYNAADVTVNISNAEGFGMGTLESLFCGTPIIATWTGGMREQLVDNIDDPKEFYGIPLFPATKTLIGSPELPWIYEDQVSEEDLVNAFLEMYNLTKEQRKEWGKKGSEHVNNMMSWDKFNEFWPALFSSIHSEHGSWPNRKYKSWRFEDLTWKQRYESTKKPMVLPASTRINKSHYQEFLKNSKTHQI